MATLTLVNTPVVQHTSDTQVKKQHELLETLQAQPYFRSFNPRAYPEWESRHYKPIDYLEAISIQKIAEIVQHNYSLTEICCMLDISTSTMRNWLRYNKAYALEIEEAKKWGADNYAYRSIRILEESSPLPDLLNKNKAIAEGYRWMAERHNKEVYGTKTIKHEGNIGTTVQYNINIGGQALPLPAKDAVTIDHDAPILSEEELISTAFPSLDFANDGIEENTDE